MPNILLYENGKTYDASLLIQKDGTIAGVQKMDAYCAGGAVL